METLGHVRLQTPLTSLTKRGQDTTPCKTSLPVTVGHVKNKKHHHSQTPTSTHLYAAINHQRLRWMKTSHLKHLIQWDVRTVGLKSQSTVLISFMGIEPNRDHEHIACEQGGMKVIYERFLPGSMAWTLTGLSEQIVNPKPSFPRMMLTWRKQFKE